MKLQDEIFDVIVVGGGASGMMTAGISAQNGKKVLIIEKNKNLGEKLKITGGGRCNITNAEFDVHKLLKNYGLAENFLYSPFSQFGVKETFEFFESRNLPLVVEARNRAFPKSQKAKDVFKVFEKLLKEKNVLIKTQCPVKEILFEEIENIKNPEKARIDKNNIPQKTITGLKTDQGIFRAKSYVFAVGGSSHKETGSTGDGFVWLRDLGHSVKSPTPTIVPLSVSDNWVKSLSGTSLSFMKITFYSEEKGKSGVKLKKAFSKTGKILFTHFGLSGPLILNSASEVADLLQEGNVTATIDAFPDTDVRALDEKITKIFDKNKNKDLKNIFKEIAPNGTSEAILSLLESPSLESPSRKSSELLSSKKVNLITKEERRKIVDLLKALPVTITGLMGFDRAVVADGGVDLREVDLRTMRSKLFDNLLITGDLLNINRPSGGYSLQICWTTGYIAGKNA